MLNAISGWQTANIYSYPIGKDDDGKTVVLSCGDWVKFKDGGLVIADSYDGTKAVFPVYMGNKEAYDIRYHNRVEVVTASSGVLETDKYAAGTYEEGDGLTVVDGELSPASDAASVVGFVVRMTNNNQNPESDKLQLLQFKLK